jgi:hypothetical protein
MRLPYIFTFAVSHCDYSPALDSPHGEVVRAISAHAHKGHIICADCDARVSPLVAICTNVANAVLHDDLPNRLPATC